MQKNNRFTAKYREDNLKYVRQNDTAISASNLAARVTTCCTPLTAVQRGWQVGRPILVLVSDHSIIRKLDDQDQILLPSRFLRLRIDDLHPSHAGCRSQSKKQATSHWSVHRQVSDALHCLSKREGSSFSAMKISFFVLRSFFRKRGSCFLISS